MKIYTRTGDRGETSLFNGTRIQKNDPFIQALGDVDEGNSAIGVSLSFLPKEAKFQEVKKQLETIQHALFDVGAALANPSLKKSRVTRFDSQATVALEQWIDQMDQQLPPLRNFILPGGHPTGANLHLARSIIRRAERSVVPLYQQNSSLEDVLVYLNRLSDYLFVVARLVNHLSQKPEVLWEPHLIS